MSNHRNLSKAVVLLSGGMDSTTLAYDCAGLGFEMHTLSVDYGQRHRKELESAAAVSAREGWTHVVLDLSGLRVLLPGSSLTDDAVSVPEGHYADESMKATVVPNRNMVLLSLAAAHAIAIGATVVAYAAHAGDHAVYPDCRPEFVVALGHAMSLCDYEPPMLYTPFIDRSKAEIASIGQRLGVPFGLTWSCYNGREKHCGKCGTCVERREAFELAGVDDPTEYE